MLTVVEYDGRLKCSELPHIKQQFLPQSVHHWNLHSLLTYMSLLRLWRHCRNLWRYRTINRSDSQRQCKELWVIYHRG